MKKSNYLLYNKEFLEDYILNNKLNEQLFEFIKQRINLLSCVTSLPECINNCKENWNEEMQFEFTQYINTFISKQNNREKITAVVLTFNEERCIKRCLESISNSFQRILIVDTGSTDNTLEIIKDLNNPHIELIQYEWANSFADVRNYALNYIDEGWAFFIDADEVLIEDPEINIIDKINLFDNFEEWDNLLITLIIRDRNNSKKNLARLFRVESGIKYYGNVHEQLRKTEDIYSGEIQNIAINIELFHDGYNPEVMNQKDKLNRNLKLLYDTIDFEPNNPEWLLFLVRDGMSILSLKDKLKYLTNAIKLCKPNLNDSFYYQCYVWAYKLIIENCIISQNISNIKSVIKYIKMKNIDIPNSDLFYYEMMSKILDIRFTIKKLLEETIEYRENHINTDPRALHSEGYHLDYLIMVLLGLNGNSTMFQKYNDFLRENNYLD